MIHSLKRALTLVELIVVLLILSVVAGVVVNKLPGVVNRANNTAWLANLNGIDNVMSQYHAANNGKYPDGFDSLVNSTDALYTGLPGGASGNLSTNVLEARTITTDELARLNRAGISTVQLMKDDHTAGFGATYYPHVSGSFGALMPVTITDSTTLAFLKKNTSGTYLHSGQKYQFNDDHAYVVFGFGQASSLVGPDGWVKDCPVLLHPNGSNDPSEVYCRAGLIFDVGGADSGRYDSAKFIGAVVFQPVGFHYTDEKLNIPDLFE